MQVDGLATLREIRKAYPRLPVIMFFHGGGWVMGGYAPTHERMVRELQRGLDDNERRFLVSLVAGTPDWSLLGIAHLEYLPGIRWKLHNLAQLQKTNAKKFAEQAELLSALLAAAAPDPTAEPTSGAE